jgi:hypothetical protein
MHDRQHRRTFGLGLGLAAVIGAGTLLSAGCSSAAQATVPDLTGGPVERRRAAHLRRPPVRRPDHDRRADRERPGSGAALAASHVVGQSPAAGTEVPEDSAASVRISQPRNLATSVYGQCTPQMD